MIFARYFRKDLVTGLEVLLVDIAIIPRGLSLQATHEKAIEFSWHRARAGGAVAYQLFEGKSFMHARPISLTHLLV
jgi:hypothetical protein